MVMVSFGPTGYKVVRLPVAAAVRESSTLDLQIFQFGQHHSDEENRECTDTGSDQGIETP